MARYGSDDAFILVDGYNLSGLTTTGTAEIEAITEATHGLGDSWEEQSYVGLKRAMLTQEGFYDDAALQSNVALVGSEGLSRLALFGLEGNVIGEKAIAYMGALESKTVRIATRGELHKLNVEYVGNGAVHDAIILHALGAEDASPANTQSASVDNAAQSTTGAVAFLQVTSLTLGGYTNCIIQVDDSANNSAWLAVSGGAFTAVTAAPTAQTLVIPGTIRRYLSVSWAFTGAGSGESVSFIVGVTRT
jgi:hypothetical protein